MLELYVLFGIILLLSALIIYYAEEPFENPRDDTFYLQSCPTEYKSFTDSDGSTLCCNGTIVANECNGDKQCTLTGPGTATIPNCTHFLQDTYKKKGEQCPSSMPSYYEHLKEKGCTAGGLNKTMDGPGTTGQPVCKIYNTLDDNINKRNSCYNQKEMDNFPCFGTHCTKSLTQNKENTPVLITIAFTDSNGIMHTTHTRDSMKRFLDMTQPNWKDKGMNLNKNISIAEVAKAYYIDRTMQQDEIQN